MEMPFKIPETQMCPSFFWGRKTDVIVGNFHSLHLDIIRLEIASEAVCSLVALVTAWALRRS